VKGSPEIDMGDYDKDASQGEREIMTPTRIRRREITTPTREPPTRENEASLLIEERKTSHEEAQDFPWRSARLPIEECKMKTLLVNENCKMISFPKWRSESLSELEIITSFRVTRERKTIAFLTMDESIHADASGVMEEVRMYINMIKGNNTPNPPQTRYENHD
jgi:hypothetical protein